MIHIETWDNNSILRTKSSPIKISDMKKHLKLWKEMLWYIKNTENWWVWLAAPQVWYNIRMIVVSLLKDWDDENYKTVLMINPEILEFSENQDSDTEWCLSIPWERWKVKRASQIKLKYFNEKWEKRIIILNNLSARIVQHEIDHLDGILFTDYLLHK